LPGNGDGTFGDASVIVYTGRTERIETADLNGDGNLDLMVEGTTEGTTSQWIPCLIVLLGNGDGTFTAPANYLGNYTGGGPIHFGDKDQDGDVDVFIGNPLSNDVSFFRNAGDGTFQTQIRYGSAGWPIDLRFGDFTGDGVGDLAVMMSVVEAVPSNGPGVSILEGIRICAGSFASYGSGLAGTGNKLPVLQGSGCPVTGQTIAWNLSNGLAGAPAALLLGTATASIPALGGTILVGGVFVGVPMILDGSGSASIEVTIPNNPALMGSVLYAQLLVLDAGAPKGVSFSAGLETHIE